MDEMKVWEKSQVKIFSTNFSHILTWDGNEKS